MTDPLQPTQPTTRDATGRDAVVRQPSTVNHQWDAPPPVPPTRLSGLARAAGVVLIVLGALVAIAGIAFFAFSGMADGAGGATLPGGVQWTDTFGQALTIIAVILLVLAVGYVLSGIAVVRGSEAGRWGGIALGVLGALLTLPGATASTGQGSNLFNILVVAAHVFVVVVLAMRWRARTPGPGPNLPA